MDMLKLAGLKESLEKSIQLHEKMKELYVKLMEAVYIDQYMKSNPNEDRVYLISFRLNKDEFLKSYKITNDRIEYNKFLDAYNSHSMFKKRKYPDLEVKSVDLKKARKNRDKKQFCSPI